MHLTHRSSGWRFQIRVPRDLEHIFGSTPLRLNLGPISRRSAARVARLLAGHAESVFFATRRRTVKMSSAARDDLVEELQSMLLNAFDMSEAAIATAERRRILEVKTVTLNLLTDRLKEQQEFGQRMRSLNGGMHVLKATVAKLPKPQRDALAAQIDELSALVKQSLEGGPKRPNATSELERWLDLREGHASEKKVRTDGNRIRDFINFAGDKPVNAYRYSDFQQFANLLARVPANYVKDPRIRHMTREEAAMYNDSLPPARRLDTLAATAIESNYLSPLRMFFRAMAAEHDFRSPLADISITIPPNAKESVVRTSFNVTELNLWFVAAAKEKRPDLKWLPLLGTLTGARVGEMIFLQGKDIYEIKPGMWVADLVSELTTPDGGSMERKIKNRSSRRLFALHEVLQKTGFIDYCRSRHHDEWLFPHAFRHGKTLVSNPADAASKRLNLRLKKVGVHKPLETTFHSSRHTAKDIMRVAQVDARTASRQTGHAMTSVGDKYGAKTMRADEVEVLAALPLPEGLDLTPYLRNK